MNKTAWLADMGYVVKTARKGLFRLDYVSARRLLQEYFGSVSAFLFNGFDPSFGIPEGLKKFYQAMEHQGMQVRLHPMSGDPSAGDHRQRRVDVDIAAHLVWQATLPVVETVVITSGDQDLLPAVAIAKEQFGKRIVLFTYGRDVHTELRLLADVQLVFEDHRNRLERS